MFVSSGTVVEVTYEEQKTEKKVKKANYFDVREEEAVRNYITAESKEEKEEIYNKFLRDPLNKMIESIIRRYKLYRKDMEYDNNHQDTHSFIITKIDKFKPGRNKKAYSYFGTICKNYLMGQIQKEQKDMNRKVSYEDISSTLENRPDMIYYLEFEKIDAEKIIEVFMKEDKEIRLLTYKILVEKFNNKYQGMSERQKDVLKEYITNISDTKNLKLYLNGQLDQIKNELTELKETSTDAVVKIKLEEVIKFISPIKENQSIKDEVITGILQYFDLIDELKKG